MRDIARLPASDRSDLFRMGQSAVREEAMKQADLLQKVAEFKTKFYPRKWARYDEARVGTLKLIPPEYRFPALINDYNAMRTMFFGEVPAFDAVMDGIRQMEDEINTANV